LKLSTSQYFFSPPPHCIFFFDEFLYFVVQFFPSGRGNPLILFELNFYLPCTPQPNIFFFFALLSGPDDSLFKGTVSPPLIVALSWNCRFPVLTSFFLRPAFGRPFHTLERTCGFLGAVCYSLQTPPLSFPFVLPLRMVGLISPRRRRRTFNQVLRSSGSSPMGVVLSLV